MCTVFLRVHTRPELGVLVAAVRDEFTDRPWSAPGRHWPERHLVGGLDLVSGGTWLAVRTDRPAVAVLVNGPGEVPEQPGSRGVLPLRMLTGGAPTRHDVTDLPGFHLLHAEPGRTRVISWDGRRLRAQDVHPGDHMLTYGGLDDLGHARVRRFLPQLPGLADDVWRTLLEGPEPLPAAEEALLVDRLESGRSYATTSAALVRVGHDRLTYDFTADPRGAGTWRRMAGPVRSHR
ncbi:NRDE family protein [Streptomyces sp. NPDC097107]|uniref:NRDE family protein n=1 Tax=Streptomyces sp. NPDC097107 TaxID=3366089 RepID=UPI0037F2866A